MPDDITKDALIDKLNEDLAGELQAVIQYATYAARVTGPYRPQLAEFFRAEIADELGHAQFLAEKIAALGGKPTTVPRAVPDANSNQQMLQRVLEAEKQAIRDYSERAEQAETYGDKGLQVRLEDIVADETEHYEETMRILKEWPV
jgi:bacterioferritin